MHTYPQKSSVEMVRAATGQDLGHLTRDEFIVRVEALLKEQEELEEPARPDAHGVVKVTLKNVNLGAAALAAVLGIEKNMRLN